MATGEPEELAAAAAEIRQAVTGLARQMRAGRSPEALSVNKLSILARLRRSGPATPGELAAAEHQQPQSLTRVFAELEHTGLITRSRDERDRRQFVLALTGAGREALVRDMAERDRWLAAALGGLTPTEREVLRLAASLMDRLAEDGPGSTEAAHRTTTH